MAEDEDDARAGAQAQQESLEWEGLTIPIVRAGMPDLFVALKPPKAEPYVMAPYDTEPQVIVDFFASHLEQIKELRRDMLKRYEKSSSIKCRYQTGDVAYALGRPFQLRVYPLAEKRMKLKSGARGTTTYKYSIDPAVSLITLYVVHPGNYDEGKKAFDGYAEPLLLRNAEGMTKDFMAVLAPGESVPTIRMRAMRGRWSSNEAGALWLSTDLIPYPPDCLVWVLWRELEKLATISPEECETHLKRILPGWEAARNMLAERAQPYSLQ